jgi:hypothetical protein
MSLFRRKPRAALLVPVEYLDWEIVPWFETPYYDFDAASEADQRIVKELFAKVIGLPDAAYESVVPDIAPYVKALLPVAERHATFQPVNPAALMTHFTRGWWLARIDRRTAGYTPPRRVSLAVRITMGVLSATGDGALDNLTVFQFVQAGYYASRRHMEIGPVERWSSRGDLAVWESLHLSPEDLAQKVSIPATLSWGRVDGALRRARQTQDQNEAGRAWMAERAAEKARRREEWQRQRASGETEAER